MCNEVLLGATGIAASKSGLATAQEAPMDELTRPTMRLLRPTCECHFDRTEHHCEAQWQPRAAEASHLNARVRFSIRHEICGDCLNVLSWPLLHSDKGDKAGKDDSTTPSTQQISMIPTPDPYLATYLCIYLEFGVLHWV